MSGGVDVLERCIDLTEEYVMHAHDEARDVLAGFAEVAKCADATVKAFESLGNATNIAAQIEAHRACERALIEQAAALQRITSPATGGGEGGTK